MSVRYTTLKEIPDYVYQNLNYPHEGKCSDIVLLSRLECDAYYEAAYECFKMLDIAAEYVIEHNKLSDMGIPEFMHDIIKKTYNAADEHPHMLGRFDFAGGIDREPIKLIEFNADTPFSIFETAVVQYALCKAAGLDPDNNQYNTIYEELIAFFKYLKEVYPEIDTVYFTSHNDGEDELNTSVIMETAQAAGLVTTYKHWTDIAVDDRYNIVGIEGIEVVHTGEQLFHITDIEHLVKMVPWDLICTYDEQSIASAKDIVNSLNLRSDTTISNPPYAMLYQSKALLSVMYELFPKSKYLLQSHIVKDADDKLKGSSYVLKPIFGREGQNIVVVKDNEIVEQTDGYYDEKRVQCICQELTTFPKDDKNRYYQAGVFISRETPCGIGFRRSEPDKNIITTDSDLYGHIIDRDS